MTKRSRSKQDIEDLSCAWIAYFGIYDEELVKNLASDRFPDPETKTIKDDLYQKLSDEAKEVIDTILASPQEFIDACIAPKTGEFKRRRKDNTYFIKKYFRGKWGSRLKVRRVFRELEIYIKKII